MIAAVRLALVALAPAMALAASPAALHATPGLRFLAIDPSAIPADKPSSGLKVQLGPVAKDPKSPFFGEDQPWDVAWWNTYPTIAYDATDSKYKLWYVPQTARPGEGHAGDRLRLARACIGFSAPAGGMSPHLDQNPSKYPLFASCLVHFCEMKSPGGRTQVQRVRRLWLRERLKDLRGRCAVRSNHAQ